MNRDRYRVKTVVTTTGERLPMLLNSDGMPLWGATVFSLTQHRARNRAANTIGNSLRALLVFHLFLDLRNIDLSARMADGLVLGMGEIEELVRLCKLPVHDISSMFETSEVSQSNISALSLEKVRRRVPISRTQEVVPAFAATRLRSIRDYVSWMVAIRMSMLGRGDRIQSVLEAAGRLVTSAIDARLPSGDSRGSLGEREGLEPKVVAEILRVIDPHSPDNPWQNEHSRYRNELIILWLLYLGLRRGELLGVRVSDINFRKGTVIVARRADDVTDPRKMQPNAKTKAREIPISTGLQDKTIAYVMKCRGDIPGARKHDFLIVASDSGNPFSIPSFAKVFNILREKCPQLPRHLFAHLLRHTWNDRFSEEMDKQNVGEETEKKSRSYLMGWSETSGTAATYTRRHVRKKAQEASLAMQDQILAGGKK